jgi:hypothetical protein
MSPLFGTGRFNYYGISHEPLKPTEQSKSNKTFVYSVKFVCGTQQGCTCEDGACSNYSASTIIRPGAYSTEINIHNYQDSDVHIIKYLLPVVFAGSPVGREPRFVQPKAKDNIVLPPNTATMDDCYRIGELLLAAPPSSTMPLMIGFLEIISTHELNVTAVYTVSDLKSDSISIDVEQIQGRTKERDR